MALYTVLYNWLSKPGFPVDIECTFTESLDTPDPYNKPVQTGGWPDYDVYKGKPVPPSGEFALPDKLYWVCKNLKRFDVDFFYKGYFFRFIVSGAFLEFIRENSLLEGEYDYCPLEPVSPKKDPIALRGYYYLRVFRFHNHIVDRNTTPKVKKQRVVLPMHYYPHFNFVEGAEVPPMFFINDPVYAQGFFCNEEIKSKMVAAQLAGFALVPMQEFADEQQFRDGHPYPETELMKSRSKY